MPPRRLPAAKKKKRRVIRLDNDERRAQLLALGRDAFMKQPYDDVSIDDLARKAKLSKGIFYYYFPTKRDLYTAGLRDTAHQLMVKLKQVPRDLPPRARTTAAVDLYLDHVQQHGQAFVALMRGGIGNDPEVVKVVEAVRRGILEEFLSGAPVSQFLRARPLSAIAIRGWIGLVESASIEWLSAQTVPREPVRELLVDMLFDMLMRVLDPKDAERYRQPVAG